MVVTDSSIVIPGRRIDVSDLDKFCSWRWSGQITPLIRLAPKQPVSVGKLVVGFHIELMIVVGLDRVGLEVVAGAALIACRRPYRAVRNHVCRDGIEA